MVLGRQGARLERAGEEVGELAVRELRANLGAVRCLREEVRVGVEGHARSGVAEDAADLGDVEADVDDQVAGEGVAQVVEAQAPLALVKAGLGGGARRSTRLETLWCRKGVPRPVANT
jgi:hypothetical protein